MKNCLHCKKEIQESRNYCDFACGVALAKAEGSKEHLPNGLPISCITASGFLLECEHGEHLDYKFPVRIQTTVPERDPEYREYPQTHAFIYTDGVVAVTMYEANYYMWSLHNDGETLGGRYAYKTDRLSEESCKKVLDHFEKTMSLEIDRRAAQMRDESADPVVRAEAELWLARARAEFVK